MCRRATGVLTVYKLQNTVKKMSNAVSPLSQTSPSFAVAIFSRIVYATSLLQFSPFRLLQKDFSIHGWIYNPANCFVMSDGAMRWRGEVSPHCTAKRKFIRTRTRAHARVRYCACAHWTTRQFISQLHNFGCRSVIFKNVWGCVGGLKT